MIQHPSVLALLAASLLALAAVLSASGVAVDVLRRWDLSSGAREQLLLERRTRLASILVRWASGLQLVSLFLFVQTADAVAPLFTGAMCAAGTLQAAPWGYAALGAKLAAFIAAGVWLVVSHADAQAPDYPLVRHRHRLALLLVPIFALEAGLGLAWFRGLEPEVITSCCGSLFTRAGGGLGADLAGLPPLPAAVAMYAIGGGTLVAAAVLRRTGRGALVLAALGAAALPAGVAGVIAAISPYVYELPNHHCPFCLLKAEYGRVGWAAWGSLLVAVVAALSAGALARHARAPSLASVLPVLQRRLAGVVLAAMGTFLAVATWSVLASSLRA